MIGFQIFIGAVYFYVLFELVDVWHISAAGAFLLGIGAAVFFSIIYLYWEWVLSNEHNNNKDDNDG